MKKSIIALAVAGALTAPMVAQADATLYGSLRLNLGDLGTAGLGFNDNTSRIGIKGSSELFNGNKAIFQFEEGVNAADGGWKATPRLATIGVTGDFGTVNFGRMWTPHTLWTVLPFHTQDNTTDVEIAGYVNGLTGLTRLPNVGAYVSPNMNGLQFAVAIMADDNANDEDVDAVNVAAKYAAGDLYVAVSHNDVPNVGTHTSVGATYKADAVKVGARYATTDLDAGGDVDGYSVFANYTMENTTLVAAFTDNEALAGVTAQDEKVWTLEARQQLGKQARAYVAWIGDDDADGLEVGYRVDF